MEMQPPASWSSNAIQITVNTAGYTNGQTSYLYVFDATGTPNSAGYAITINSGSTVVIPDSAFTASPTSGQSPLLVNFTDQSANIPTSWSWNFGANATPATSTEQNPSTTYGAGGAKTVTLAASNSAGTDATPASTSIPVRYLKPTNFGAN
jgi:PKD repeat protein